jgi:class 3 adenylate cyclase
MPAATVLFVDVVGFSSRGSDDQTALTHTLNEALRALLGRWHAPQSRESDVIALPTGDGAAIVFLEGASREWRFDDVVRTAYGLTRWAAANGAQICAGIHGGSVARVIDVNGHPNVCGDAINKAQRVMSAADPGQVLVSEETIASELGDGQRRREVAIDGEVFVLEVGATHDVFAKHDRRIAVGAARLKRADGTTEQGWSGHVPQKVGVLPLRQTPKGAPITDFALHVARARRIALVQLTGARLIAEIESGRLVFSEELDRLIVLLPDPTTCARFGTVKPMDRLAQSSDRREQWKSVLAKVAKTRPAARIELRVHSQPPYFAGSFLDWEERSGRIHVSPYIWGLDSRDCPGVDLIWQAERRHDVYASYVDGLQRLIAHSTEVAIG